MSLTSLEGLSVLFERRVRGFRVVELWGLGVFLVLALTVYLLKAGAGHDRAQIAAIDRQITTERNGLRVLQAEVAHLEQPERIERLATEYLGLAPIAPKHEITPEALPEVALLASPQSLPASTKLLGVLAVPAVSMGADH
jgi:cell division protein FtsL